MLAKAELSTQDRFRNLFAGKVVVAIEPETGIELVVSRGRAKRGGPPNYILIAFDSRNPRIKAWSDDEAIDLANQKLTRLRTGGRVPELLART